MKLRTKILLAEVPLVLLLAGVGVYSVKSILDLGGMADRIVDDNYRSILAAQRMEEELDAIDRATIEGRAPLEPRVAAFERELSIQEHNITEAGEADATRDLRAAFDGLRATPLDPAPRARVRAAIQRVLGLNEDALVRKSAETRRYGRELAMTQLVAALGALALVTVLGFLLSDRIARPLVRLARAARKIGEGDLEVALETASGGDEVAGLVREFASMTEKLRSYRRSSLGELLEATESAQAAIDSLADPVLNFGETGVLRRANEAARRLGIDLDQADPLARLVPELRGGIERVRDRVLSGKGAQAPRGLESAIAVLVDGQPRYLQPFATPIKDGGGGAIVGTTVLLRDVTSLRRADELKNDLLATVAHELRTPLTSLRMALHLTLEAVAGPLTEKQADLLQSAREDAERLHRLIEGILSVSKIEAGVLVGRRRAMEPRALVETALAPLRVAAADRRIALAASAPDRPLVEVDPDSVGLVLGNLLGNALRHTPEGGRIDVNVEATPDAVTFAVSDTGPGIPPEHRPRLFEKFYRVPGSSPGGTGLGLSIARDIVFAHEGEIGVESEVGAGSRFWFRLPTRGSIPPAIERAAAL